MSIFDTIGPLLGKSHGSSTSVPKALVAAEIGDHVVAAPERRIATMKSGLARLGVE